MNLTPESRAYIKLLREDYARWAADLYQINNKANELVSLNLNLVQKKIGQIEQMLLRKYGKARIYALKGRQGGISTDQQARALHTVWSKPGATALTLAHSREDTDKLWLITQRAVRNFPKELLPSLGRGDSKEITFPGIDSHFWTGTAGAKRVGRGVTLNRFHGSEFAFWDDPKRVLGSVTPAMIPHGSVMVLETTPDAYGSQAHEYWNDAVQGKNSYYPAFFPWWECDLVNYQLPLYEPDELGKLDEEETLLIEKEHLSLEQIKWRRAQIQELGKVEFMREYPEDAETCWATGGEKFFDSDLIWRLLRNVPEKKEENTPSVGGTVIIYDTPTVEIEVEGKTGTIEELVIIGADVAEGSIAGKGDRSAWTARAFPSWRVLAEYASPHIEPTPFAALLFEWGMFYNEALLVIEKNSHGITVLRQLRDLKYPLRSIYHRTILGKRNEPKTPYIGWVTTAESRPLMLDAAREMFKAAEKGFIGVPTRACLRDAWSVADGDLTGRDVLASDILTWLGREYLVRRQVKVMEPLYW